MALANVDLREGEHGAAREGFELTLRTFRENSGAASSIAGATSSIAVAPAHRRARGRTVGVEVVRAAVTVLVDVGRVADLDAGAVNRPQAENSAPGRCQDQREADPRLRPAAAGNRQ